jgi:hypothetical protein
MITLGCGTEQGLYVVRRRAPEDANGDRAMAELQKATELCFVGPGEVLEDAMEGIGMSFSPGRRRGGSCLGLSLAALFLATRGAVASASEGAELKREVQARVTEASELGGGSGSGSASAKKWSRGGGMTITSATTAARTTVPRRGCMKQVRA